MARWSMKGRAAAVFAAAALMLPATALAQRDPAYEQARASGAIGEKPDGYLGFVTTPGAELRALVEDLNIKRKALYTRKASEQNATVETYAFTSGCTLIAQTRPGERYQAPDGSWQTRGPGAPVRDPRCP